MAKGDVTRTLKKLGYEYKAVRVNKKLKKGYNIHWKNVIGIQVLSNGALMPN